MRNNGDLASDAPAIPASPTGIEHPATEQLTDRESAFHSFDVGHARNWIGHFAADVDTIAVGLGATRAGKGLGERVDRKTTFASTTEHEHGKVVGVPYGRRFVFVFLAGGQHLT